MKQLGIAMLLALTSYNVLASTSPKGAVDYIISPADGEVVTSPFKVQFGLGGMGVAPAGTDKKNTGHHHLIIDAATPAKGKPIPKDRHHMHFGGGQTEATIKLSPGKHTLQLVLGDKAHIPFTPMVASKKITIWVK